MLEYPFPPTLFLPAPPPCPFAFLHKSPVIWIQVIKQSIKLKNIKRTMKMSLSRNRDPAGNRGWPRSRKGPSKGEPVKELLDALENTHDSLVTGEWAKWKLPQRISNILQCVELSTPRARFFGTFHSPDKSHESDPTERAGRWTVPWKDKQK